MREALWKPIQSSPNSSLHPLKFKMKLASSLPF